MLPPPFTYRGGVLRGLQLRTLWLETELEKRKKDSGDCPCLFPLLRGQSGDWDKGVAGRVVCCTSVFLAHEFLFLTCDIFCHILPEELHILAPPVQNFFEREEM